MNRERMIYIYLAWLLTWYAGAALAIHFLGLSSLEALGIGTAGGVFVAGFKDAWQFLWRKAGPGDGPK